MPEKAGQPFGKYVLLDRLAAGGMAEVYRAKFVAAAGVTKSVVIKRILPHYAGNRQFVSMFINEAKIAVGLAHGNIAQVFDFGEIDGEYYLAMEYVHGESLSRLHRRARELSLFIPIPLAVFIASEVCQGLYYAHTRSDEKGAPLNIVHRDVSPQNVIVSFEGQVKLVDFGIAKARSATQAETEHGAMKGKYVYFSPEQTRARPVDARSDIFAVGIVLYELLTGRLPFDGKMIEVLARIQRCEFDPPTKLNPRVTPELEQILLKAMALRPEDRYQTAMELHEALVKHLHAAYPEFARGSVQHLAEYLCRDTLEKEGVVPKIPQEFVRWLEGWQKLSLDGPATLPPGPAPAPETTIARGKSNASKSGASRAASDDEGSNPEALTDEVPSGPVHALKVLLADRKKAALLATLALATAIGSGVLVVSLTRPKTFSLAVSSEPAGAAIYVDGVPAGRNTPAQVAGLTSDKPHRVDLLLPDHKTFEATLPPQKADTVTLTAKLERGEGVMQAPSPNSDDIDPPDEAADAAGPVVEWPKNTLDLDAKAQAVGVLSSRAARMRLDPKHTYRLTVEGLVNLPGGDGRTLRSAFFFGERQRGTRSEGSFGQLSPDSAAVVTGLRALYGFILADAPGAATGALKIRVQDLTGRETFVLVVDPARNALEPSRPGAAKFTGLDPKEGYWLALSGSADLGAEGGMVRSALFFKTAEGHAAVQGVVGTSPVRIEGATEVYLLLPDDDRGDNSGALTARLERAAEASR